MAKAELSGADLFFSAIDTLTYRQMLDVAGLIALQIKERGAEIDEFSDPEVIAKILADAAESHLDGEEDA